MNSEKKINIQQFPERWTWPLLVIKLTQDSASEDAILAACKNIA